MPVEKRVAVGLWRLATGADYRSLQELFGIGRSTACNIFQEFVTAVVVVLKQRFLRHPTDQEFQDIARGFRDTWGMPQCVGAIDGTHIPIIAPSEHRNSYYNRKGWYSMICQAVCDHRGRFWDIYVGWPGRCHDARVFANSPLLQSDTCRVPNVTEPFANVQVPMFIAGDPAYPLLTWLMKAYPENAGTPEEQRYFNYRLSRARMVIECAFGRLKGRWRLLMKRMDNDLSLVPTIVLAACVLHNMCETLGDDVEDGLPAVVQQPVQHHPQNARADQRRQDRRAREIRDALCTYLAENRLP